MAISVRHMVILSLQDNAHLYCKIYLASMKYRKVATYSITKVFSALISGPCVEQG